MLAVDYFINHGGTEYTEHHTLCVFRHSVMKILKLQNSAALRVLRLQVAGRVKGKPATVRPIFRQQRPRAYAIQQGTNPAAGRR